MVENTVVKEHLTDAMIAAGAELTQKLDEMGIPITASLWLFVPDINEWRLFFASPEVTTSGPRAVYQKIQQALVQLQDKASAVPLSVVRLLDADDDLVQSLRVVVRTGPGPGVSRMRFTKNAVNGHYIEDALIYRAS
ncbi:MAG: hypothetical protein L0241_13795 [Planctomycetia bacterium]|nr:hypothetical protein [Planctomycetia bacterium]